MARIRINGVWYDENDSAGINAARAAEAAYYERMAQRETATAAAPVAQAYQAQGDAAAAGGISAAQQGVGLAQQGISAAQSWADMLKGAMGNTSASYETVRGDASQVRQSAAGMGASINAVNTQAAGMGASINAVNAQADAMKPYAGTLRDYANALWDRGNTLWNQGQGMMSQGRSILDLDNSGGGLVGEYVDWIRSIDPDRYVSMAAADTQAAYQNAMEQQVRAMTRAGADASSTKTAAFRLKVAQGLSAALAGARTRARQQGLSDMGKALESALGVAQNFTKQGADIATQSVQAANQASANQASAAKIEGDIGTLRATAGDLTYKQGALYGEAGDLTYKQGALYGEAAKIEAEAAKLMQSNASLGADMAKVLVSAYGNAASAASALSNAQATAAKYYGETAAGYGELAGSALFS